MLSRIRLISTMILIFFIVSIFSPYLQYAEAIIYSSISGRVIDSKTGEGIADVEIFALLKSTSSSLVYFYTKTDIQGRYIFEKVTPGTYEIIVFPTSFSLC